MFFLHGKLHPRNGNPFDADSESEMMASLTRTGDFPVIIRYIKLLVRTVLVP